MYSITRGWPEDTERIPLFGAQVDFHLEGVVNCPEFLVHFPTLEKLAAKYDLVNCWRRKFGMQTTYSLTPVVFDLLE